MQRQTVVISRILLGGAASALVAPPAGALTPVTGIVLKPTANGLEVVLQLQAAAQGKTVERPLVFTSGQGNTWVATITNAQLNLPANQPYRQEHPAPGIATLSITSTSVNSLQVTVTSQPGTLMGQAQQEGTKLTLNLLYTAASTTPLTAGQAPPAAPPVQATRTASTPTPSAPAASSVTTATTSPSPTVAPTPAMPPAPMPALPFPKPTIATTPLTPQKPVASTPPSSLPPGNQITYTDLNVQPATIDLGTSARIERVVLRETPVREALALLAHAADLGIVYAEDGV